MFRSLWLHPPPLLPIIALPYFPPTLAFHTSLPPLPLSPQAIELLVESLFEFNACVPYAGPCASALGPRGGAAHLDVTAMTALLALLPGALQPGVLCNHLPADEAKMVWGGKCVE